MRKIITFGTFDLFHKGHESYLKQAKKLGDFLIVVVARDVNAKKVKGALPFNSEKKRTEKIKKSGLADLVVIGDKKDRYRMLEKYKPDIIGLGYDQKVDVPELKKKLLEFGLENVRIKRLKAFKPDIYKSSKIARNNTGKNH